MRFLFRALRAASSWLLGWPRTKVAKGTEAGRRSVPMPNSAGRRGFPWPVLRELPIDEPPRPAPRSPDQPVARAPQGSRRMASFKARWWVGPAGANQWSSAPYSLRAIRTAPSPTRLSSASI